MGAGKDHASLATCLQGDKTNKQEQRLNFDMFATHLCATVHCLGIHRVLCFHYIAAYIVGAGLSVQKQLVNADMEWNAMPTFPS